MFIKDENEIESLGNTTKLYYIPAEDWLEIISDSQDFFH